jgi:hypothetical protein
MDEEMHPCEPVDSEPKVALPVAEAKPLPAGHRQDSLSLAIGAITGLGIIFWVIYMFTVLMKAPINLKKYLLLIGAFCLLVGLGGLIYEMVRYRCCVEVGDVLITIVLLSAFALFMLMVDPDHYV